MAVGQDWRLPLALAAVSRCGGLPRRCREAPCASAGGRALISVHGNDGHGEWSRVSALAAAIPRTRWASYRIGRCGWRLGWLFLAFSSRRHQAANRAVLG